MNRAQCLKVLLMSVLLTPVLCYAGRSVSTDACKGRGSFRALPGDYEVQLQIGPREFIDRLQISSVTQDFGMGSFVADFTGKFSVPGVFDAEVLDGKLYDKFYLTGDTDHYEMQFRIVANEKGRSYPVYFHFEGHDPQPDYGYQTCFLRGEAYLKPRAQAKSEDVLGTAIMRKLSEPCICQAMKTP